MPRPKHREVWVNLANHKNDKFVIVGRVVERMRRSALPDSEVEEFRREAYKCDTIQELLELCGRWVEVTLDSED